MIKRSLIAAALVVASLSSPVQAMTGNELKRNCGDTGAKYGLCVGFVVGVVDGVLIDSPPDSIICVPDGVSHGQMKDIVLKYMNDNPANLHFPAALLVFFALGEAFPCEGK
jgi:hypothetical protein